MVKEKIDRINALAQKSRQEGLTDEERAEQHQLRQEYIQSFRESMNAALDSVYVLDENGNKVPIKQRSNPAKNLPLS